MKHRISFTLSIVANLMLAPAAMAWGDVEPKPEKTQFNLMLNQFPKGSSCTAVGARGKVKTGKWLGDPMVGIKGYAHVGDILCTLPEGRTFTSDLNKRSWPYSNVSVVNVNLNKDGSGMIYLQGRGGSYSAVMRPGEGLRFTK